MTKTYYVLWKYYEDNPQKWREYLSNFGTADSGTDNNIDDALHFATEETAKEIKMMLAIQLKEEYYILKVTEREVL